MFEKDNRDNLLGSLEDFMIKDDKTGPALRPELVKVINTDFLFRPSEEKAKTLCEKPSSRTLPKYGGSQDK